MIKLTKSYIRRKEMDSVLTSLVDDNVDHTSNLEKELKKSLNREHVYLFRDIEQAFKTLLESLPKKESNEIIISALAPSYVYEIAINNDFTPIVIDVSQGTGVFEEDKIVNKISNKTSYIVNNSIFGVIYPREKLADLGVKVIELLPSGLGIEQAEGDDSIADYSILSLDEGSIISSMGGAALSFNNSDIKNVITNTFDIKPYLRLSGLNSSFAMSQLLDKDVIVSKKEKLIEAYKDSLLKSGYHTFENSEKSIYNLFPVILKRGLKDIQKYCRQQGVETDKAFKSTIIQSVEGLKCKNAKSLVNKTIIFPIYLGINKDSVSLILKLLSTLP